MDSALVTEIGDAERLAVEYCAREFRPALYAFFALDARLGQIAAKTTEPALGQMRLAWWREMLDQPVEERPKGDVVLEALSQHWEGSEACLIEAVNAWEILIASEKLSDQDVSAIARGRAQPIVSIFRQTTDSQSEIVRSMAELWALADIAPRISDEQERSTILDLARGMMLHSGQVQRSMRGIAVLGSLARRSVMLGGRPLLEGRVAALTALRVGMIGR